MMMDVLCEEDDGFDGEEELARDVDKGRDGARIDDPGGDKLLPGKEEVVGGAEEGVVEAKDRVAAPCIRDVGGVDVLGAGGLVSRVSPF